MAAAFQQAIKHSLFHQFDKDYRDIRFQVMQACLLIVDMQRFFADPSSAAFFPAAKAIVANIKQLRQHFSVMQRPVVYTKYAVTDKPNHLMGQFWKRPLWAADPLAAIVPELAPQSSDEIIAKSSYSSFSGGRLLQLLKQHGCEQLIICGVMTHLCCDFAAKEAFSSGFMPFMVHDALASIDPSLHVGTLQAAAHGYAKVISSEELYEG